MTQRADFIIPECYVDTNFVETLVCHAGCNHQKGCNQVAKVMQDKFADRFAVGIIDADKRRPGYLGEFHSIAAGNHIEIFRHHVRPHFIILVHPAIDGFILSCVEDIGIDLATFGLPNKLKDFTKEAKDVMSNKDPRFKSLFNSLANIGEASSFKRVIEYLCCHTYQSANEDIRRIIYEIARD